MFSETILGSTVEELLEELALETTIENYSLILYNDNVNTFDHVIDSLIDICNHSLTQAEQCTWLVHYKGKCEVKIGGKEELIVMKNKLNQKGLSAEVQSL